jgi:hypothetical protein
MIISFYPSTGICIPEARFAKLTILARGSAQLINQNLFTPSCIIDKNIVEAHEKQYAYFACVAFIVKVV